MKEEWHGWCERKLLEDIKVAFVWNSVGTEIFPLDNVTCCACKSQSETFNVPSPDDIHPRMDSKQGFSIWGDHND